MGNLRAVTYNRVSTDDQAENNFSLPEQSNTNRQYTTENTFDHVGDFSDDFSGTKIDRPEFNKVRAMIRNNEVDVLVVFNLKRLARTSYAWVLIVEELRQNHVQLHFSNDGGFVDIMDDTTMIMLGLKAGMAQTDRNDICNRLVLGKMRKMKNGGIMIAGSDRPLYGYKAVKVDKIHVYEINDQQSKVVEFCYRQYLAGYSTISICRDLNERGERTNTGRKFSQTAISRILTNKAYAGKWQYKNKWFRGDKVNDYRLNEKPDIVEVDIPNIVTMEQWQGVQERLQGRKIKANGVGRTFKHDALLRRRVTCGFCGDKMSVDSVKSAVNKKGDTKRYPYYRCYTNKNIKNHSRVTAKPCPRKSHVVGGNSFDSTIWNDVLSILSDPTAIENGVNALNEDNQSEINEVRYNLDLVNGELAKALKEFDNIVDSFQSVKVARLRASLEMQAEQLDKTIQRLERRQQQLETKLSKLETTHRQRFEFAKIANNLYEVAKSDGLTFADKVGIVEALNVNVTLKTRKEYTFSCIIGGDSKHLGDYNTTQERCNNHPSVKVTINNDVLEFGVMSPC